MKIVTYDYDASNRLVKHEIDITGKNLEFVKEGLKATMRAACIRNNLELYKLANPNMDFSEFKLPSLVAMCPKLIELEHWKVVAIDEYVERMFK